MVSVPGGELFHFDSRMEAHTSASAASAAGGVIFQLAFFSSSAAIFVLMAAFNLLGAEQKIPPLRHPLHSKESSGDFSSSLLLNDDDPCEEVSQRSRHVTVWDGSGTRRRTEDLLIRSSAAPKSPASNKSVSAAAP